MAGYWQCDYRADRIWVTELDDVAFGDLANAAIKRFALGQLSVTAGAAKCAAAILSLYASAAAGGTFSPLGVMPTEVVDAAGGCVSDGGVVPVEIVGVDPGLQAASAVGF